MDTEGLQELVGEYRYKQVGVFNPGFVIMYDARNKQVCYRNLHQFERSRKTGICTELMFRGYENIRRVWPGLHVMRAKGNDTDYFWKPGVSEHHFLLVSDEDIMGDTPVLRGHENLRDLVARDPLLVDPSMGKVMPLSESGYKVNLVCKPGVRTKIPRSPITGYGVGLPLYINGDGEMVQFAALPSHPHELVIAFGRPGQSPREHGIYSPVLARRVEDDPQAKRFVEHLKEVPILPVEGLPFDGSFSFG